MRTIRGIAKRLGEDDVGGIAAELAFRFFLALFPFVLVLSAAAGLVGSLLGVGDPATLVGDLASAALPGEAASVVRPHLDALVAEGAQTDLRMGIVGALLTATAGTNAVVKALNRVHRVEETRARGHRYLVALALTVGTALLLTTSMVLLVLGESLSERLAGQEAAGAVFGVVRWPAVVVLLMLAAALVYWAAPNANRPFRWVSAGAGVFAFGWTAATYLFSAYVRNVGQHATLYGAMSGVAVTLLWFYAVGWLLLLGAEANAVLDEATAPNATNNERNRTHAEAAQQEKWPHPPRAA